jgi:hypothetical protein
LTVTPSTPRLHPQKLGVDIDAPVGGDGGHVRDQRSVQATARPTTSPPSSASSAR